MKRSTMVWIDRMFFPAFFIFRKAKCLFPKKEVNSKEFRIIKFFGLGSLARIAYVLEQDPRIKSKVRFLTLRKNEQLMKALNLEADYVNNKNLLTFSVSAVKQVFSIWRSRSVTILDMERSSNLAGLFGMLLAIGKPYRGFHFKPHKTSVAGQKWVSLYNQSAIDGIAEMLEIKLDASSAINKKSAKTTQRMAININAGDYLPERKFPLEKWIELCTSIYSHDTNVTFLLTGLASEKELVDELEQKLLQASTDIKIQNLAGKQNLHQFLTFLESVDLFITNDSGPLHLAQLKGVKTVAIWGPTSAQQVGYPDSECMLNLHQQKNCSPCFIHPKSKVAQACHGQLNCFQEMDTFDMVKRIRTFTEHAL